MQSPSAESNAPVTTDTDAPHRPSLRNGSELTDSQRSSALLNLICSTCIALTGQFMVSPLLVFALNERGYSASQIGLFSASVWLGILIATPFAAQVVSRIGARHALIQSLFIPLIALTGILLTTQILVWSALYFLSGIALSLRWVIAEACVAELAPAQRRGRVIGIYEALVGASFVLGPSILAWMGPENANAPWVALGFLFVGLIITWVMPDLASTSSKDADSTNFKGLLVAAGAAPFVVIAGLTGGFFELGIATMLPLLGLALGMSTAAAALLISVSGAGSSLVMLPLGEAADRFSVRQVMHACAATAVITSALLPLASFFPVLAWPLSFAWAAAGGALYALAMIQVGHTSRGVELIRSTSVLVLAYTAGSLAGPVIAGFAIEISIQYAMPLAFFVIAITGWWTMSRALKTTD